MGERSPITPWWWLLGALLAATLVASIVWSPAARPPVGEEVTYAMQAASLAWDGDLVYERKDRDRFAGHWGARPDRLALRERDGGWVYGAPFLYSLTVSPFVRFAPVRGAAIANALLLAGAALLAALSLARRLGPAAPLWVAVFLFASVAFGYVFRVQPDLFLLAATAAGLALAYGGDRSSRWGEGPLPDVYEGEPVTPASRLFTRWWGAGLLLAIPGVFHPFYLVLFLPALIAALDTPGRRRWIALAGLLLGAAVLLLVCVGLEPWERPAQVYDVRGSSPDATRETVEEDDAGPLFNPKLAGWNALYFLVGRSFGVLPYFLPLVLGFATYRRERGRWAIPLAVLLAAGGFLLARPFDFQGGEGAIGNRLFLPLYAALWFLAARPVRALPALAVAALAAPFLYPLWSHPAAATIAREGGRGYVAPWAERWLPYEVTQRDAPGAAFFQNGLWIKLTGPDVWRPGRGDSLRVLGESQAGLLAASSQPVEGFQLEFDGKAPSRLEVRGTELRPSLLRPDGSIVFDVPAKEPTVLPLWWTRGEDHHLYQLGFRLPGAPPAPIRFRVLPRRDLIQRSGGRDR